MPCFLAGNRLVKYILIEISNKETYMHACTHTYIHAYMHVYIHICLVFLVLKCYDSEKKINISQAV